MHQKATSMHQTTFIKLLIINTNYSIIKLRSKQIKLFIILSLMIDKTLTYLLTILYFYRLNYVKQDQVYVHLLKLTNVLFSQNPSSTIVRAEICMTLNHNCGSFADIFISITSWTVNNLSIIKQNRIKKNCTMISIIIIHRYNIN